MSDHEEPTTAKAVREADGGRGHRSAGEKLGNAVGGALYKGASFAVQAALRGAREVLKQSAIDKAVSRGLAHVAAGVGKAMAEDIKEKNKEGMEHLHHKTAEIKGSLATKVEGLKKAVKKRVKGPRRSDRH